MTIYTKKKLQNLKTECVVTQECLTYSDPELRLVPGYARKEIWYDCIHAPACRVEDKKVIPGTLLWDENPRGCYSRLTSKEQPQQWLGVGSIVYLKDCFNFSRVARFFNKSLGEMKLSPLLIAEMDKFGSFDEYTLKLLDSEKEYTINSSDYPKFEFCWLKNSQQKLGEYSAFVKAKEEEAARKELIRESERQQIADAFKERCQKLASQIKLGTKFSRGTDIYTVEEISGDKYVMRYFRGKIEATAKDLIIGWYQLIEERRKQ